MARTDPHVVETRSVNWFRTKVADFYENGDALYRGLSERDYGVDGIIELFENRMPTGKIAFVQIKATSKTITPMKRTPEFVSCSISSSNARYATQKNIPVILAYISLTSTHKMFYFADVREVITEEHKRKMKRQKEITVKIPIENAVVDDLEPMFEVIRSYY